MHVEFLSSTADLRRVQRQLRRRYVKLKCHNSEVQVTFVGGLHQARMAGSNVVAFGETPSEAKQKLTKLQSMQSVCVPKHEDVAADRAERRAERAATISEKQIRKFNPRGNRA
jgi:hypothetical protein